MPSVGASPRRKDGPDKLSGLAKYVDDYALPGCLHGVTFRSSVPHARVKNIRFDPGFPWDEYALATAEHVPGENAVTLLEKDQPLLAGTTVKHALEPLVLIAHARRERAYEALAHISAEYEPLPAVLTMEQALSAERLIYGSDNVFKRLRIDKGDPAGGFRRAAHIIEGGYRVHHQEQAYIENQGMAAWWEPDGSLVVLGSLQCPYYVVKALAPIFKLPEGKIRVVQAVTGGGFGGKEEYPNMLAGHAALLALRARRPVKMIYDRHEDMLATTKRHPALVRHRAGVTKDGKLTALEIDIVMDGGAYCTLSPVVLSRGILHATGPYECPNVAITARAVATNTPPNGAFRGFGAPQTLFAAELHWERIAEATGIDALTLRRRNLLKAGSVLSTGQVLRESVAAAEVLERAVKASGYLKRRREHERYNRRAANPAWRGVGLAAVHHGAGFTGNGEVHLASKASVALTREGRVRVSAAASEMGQGSISTLAQITADALGLPYEWIEVETPDTSRVPDSGPTVASRTCMIVGGLLHRAAGKLRGELARALDRPARTRADLARAAATLCGPEPERRYTEQYSKPAEIDFDDKAYRGDAYGAYGYACVVVDLEVDKLTFEVRLNRVWTASDVGKAIHPKIVAGQIIGGTVQALGWALLENPVYDRGVMRNAQLTNYIIPTSLDAPPIEVELVESPYSRGPFGAKGVGEMPMDAPAPAVAAAIRHATGKLFTELPILPEKLAAALHGTNGK